MRVFIVGCAVVLAGCSSSPSDGAPSADADASTEAASDVPIADGVSDDEIPTDEGATDATLPLDCAWAKDKSNCWRKFVAAVDDCLGNVAGAGDEGTLSSDGKTCSYATGRFVSFAVPVDSGSGERDFTITRGGTTCLHYVEHASATGFVVTAPTGTLSYAAKGNDVTVTCPDGSRYEGDAKKIAIACSDTIISGGVPGSILQGTSTVRFELTGSRDWDFACNVLSIDAGADADADGG